ncbi:hypothetical protein CU633_07570 [Bacillus sp. V3-13]|uniref:hypothetical protein n=1 Tax=Bacillus sp. V3-13 TaxID=2053728 RepID=UPI000C75BF14|nr:hypothetical protein [Bacillus sp. V3-13]PLR78110.1 hypothetical protein CU633_07570 [Bacillus sp. V3-13]
MLKKIIILLIVSLLLISCESAKKSHYLLNDSSFYDTNFNNYWETLSNQENLPTNTKIENFRIELDKNNVISVIEYDLINFQEKQERYKITHFKQCVRNCSQQETILNVSYADEWLQYENLTTAKRLFNNLGKLDLRNLIQGNISVDSQGENQNISMKGQYYNLQKGKLVLLNSSSTQGFTFIISKNGNDDDVHIINYGH